jgi:hypothetical protein
MYPRLTEGYKFRSRTVGHGSYVSCAGLLGRPSVAAAYNWDSCIDLIWRHVSLVLTSIALAGSIGPKSTP